jgi:hypothetical protein
MYRFLSTASCRSVRPFGSSSTRMRQDASGTSPAPGTSSIRTLTRPSLSREPPEREVQAPLDVCTEGAFQVRTLDPNIDIHLSLDPLVCLPST